MFNLNFQGEKLIIKELLNKLRISEFHYSSDFYLFSFFLNIRQSSVLIQISDITYSVVIRFSTIRMTIVLFLCIKAIFYYKKSCFIIIKK